MKLNAGAMLKAVGIGLVIELVMFGISQVTVQATGIGPTAPPEGILASSAIALVLGCAEYILYGAIGAIYGWFAHRDQGLVDVGQTALGGGITAIIVAIIVTVVSTVYGLVAGTFAQAIEQATSQIGSESSGAIMVGVIGGIIFGFCLAFVLSGGMGAAGGAIYAALARRGQAPGAATPSV